MLFNSFQFLIFFPTVTLIYFFLPHRFRWLHLLLSSCIFYCAFIPVYIFILIFTIIIDYVAGIMIERAAGKRRRMFLIMSLVANIGILAVFKYFNFFMNNMNDLLQALHITTYAFPLLKIILPLGLSFHTFQAMSYTIEVYRGNQKPEKHFGIYALYVMFYPQLVAGPIERPQNLLHQFYEEHELDFSNLLKGLRLMLWGLFKKAVIADRLSVYANAIFTNPQQYHSLQLVVGVLCFTIQIYCDFSGYSDMAIGSARCMGFKLMTNFNRPYFSTNIKEFWSRWHISLSTWFRDYVYISLGGNRLGTLIMLRNVAIVFILSGFWHGANWTFVAWGSIHAFFNISYLLAHKKIQFFRTPGTGLIKVTAWAFTFIVVALAWIFFRAKDIEQACFIFTKIFSPDNLFYTFTGIKSFGTLSWAVGILACAYMFAIEKITNPQMDWFENKPKPDLIFCTLTLFLIIAFGVFKDQSFIYFQF